MKNAKILIVCRPFDFMNHRFHKSLSFCFVTGEEDHLTHFYEDVYKEIYYEESLNLKNLPERAKSIPDFVAEQSFERLKVLFTPSSDTHCKLFEYLEDENFEIRYAIPSLENKNERAYETLKVRGVDPIIIEYNSKSSRDLESFDPDVAVNANDWSTEYRTIDSLLKKQGKIPYFGLQEGPQDWHSKINGVWPKKYLNCDCVLSQGPVTSRYIQPQFFSHTGIAKTDGIEIHPLPEEPKVFINLNFTYNNWEVDRDFWLKNCIEACQELELDYLISQHPRDNGTINDPKLVSSSAYKVIDQLLDCSISISRFSTIPLETLKLGRHSIYFNPHGESPKSYNEDKTKGISRAYDKSELKAALENHIKNYKFNSEWALESLTYHASLQDNQSSLRAIKILKGCKSNKLSRNPQNDVLSFGKRLLSLFT